MSNKGYQRCLSAWGTLASGLLLVSVNVFITRVDSIAFSVDKLTPWQKGTIEEMRRQVTEELPHSYMNDDIYLASWLSANKFHVDEAIDSLRKNLRWRKEQYIDSVLNENWSSMEREFPYQMDTFDKEGRPVLYIKIGSWNIGRMSNAIRINLLSRYFSKMMEEAAIKLRKLRAGGKDVSQITILINMDGYSFRKHSCLHCYQFYSNLASTLQAHYPRVAERVVFINAPVVFTMVFDYLHRMLNVQGEQAMELFGTDRNRWEAALLNYISRSQFPRDLAVHRQFPQGHQRLIMVPPAPNVGARNVGIMRGPHPYARSPNRNIRDVLGLNSVPYPMYTQVMLMPLGHTDPRYEDTEYLGYMDDENVFKLIYRDPGKNVFYYQFSH